MLSRKQLAFALHETGIAVGLMLKYALTDAARADDPVGAMRNQIYQMQFGAQANEKEYAAVFLEGALSAWETQETGRTP